MEGFLLFFSQESSAQVQYCVLEYGMLCCFDQPSGVLFESIELTRHRVRVQLLCGDDAGLCPNRFAVHVLEVRRNDQAGAFELAGKREKTFVFAAATSMSMTKWANAIHNWRRHAFDNPTRGALSVHDAITSNAMQNPDTKRRAVLLESQRANLLNLAIRFDVKLVVIDKTYSGKIRFCGLVNGLSSSAHKLSTEMKISRARFAIISWLPGISSLRTR
ncbi:unnamed protein product [Peronospora farinosa]|uniref:PH domain-containing protein n=1 Tax=Peronospora farinosa TaxID=134698 RepID=A0AAV0T0D9_9STRA|nr:unnamed protein product [Peronospora farinosa]CAI5709848.1 unnamed protein product [Peronospora farinosa]